MAADLKDFFLATPMEDSEYMHIYSKYLFEDICEEYDIDSKIAPDGIVYVWINKGMYSLKQAAVLAYNHLVHNLKQAVYAHCPSTRGLWHHKTHRTKFYLCIDKFGIKYFNKNNCDHLLNSLQKHYKISINLDGKNYLGLTLYWNYAC